MLLEGSREDFVSKPLRNCDVCGCVMRMGRSPGWVNLGSSFCFDLWV